MEYNFCMFSGELRFNFAAEGNHACILMTRGKRSILCLHSNPLHMYCDGMEGHRTGYSIPNKNDPLQQDHSAIFFDILHPQLLSHTRVSRMYLPT